MIAQALNCRADGEPDVGERAELGIERLSRLVPPAIEHLLIPVVSAITSSRNP
jgi:hypothetical protein